MTHILLLFSFLSILTAIAVVTALALLVGLFVVVIYHFFMVKADDRAVEINEILPGANCGGCGYSGCMAYAEAMASGKESQLTLCNPGGQETASALAAYMGEAPAVVLPKAACVHCQGTQDKVRVDYEYTGIDNCFTADSIYNGPGACAYGCLGFGDCVRVCKYDALHIEHGIAKVDPEKCVACGACVKVCPRSLIDLENKFTDLTVVRCHNPEAGKNVKAVCSIGCIGCTLCVKNCPVEAIHMEERLAVIDQELCVQCGKCSRVCPTGAITSGL